VPLPQTPSLPHDYLNVRCHVRAMWEADVNGYVDSGGLKKQGRLE